MDFQSIGRIHSPHKTKEDCPIQPVFAEKYEGQVEVFDAYAEGLADIESFSHIFLIYLLDRAGDIELVRKTFLDDTPHGIYASRHPCRPNGIGLSIVKLIERRDNMLIVSGIDVLDATPLLDIKPYVPKFDCIPSASNGWVEDKSWRPKPRDRE